MNWKKLGIIWNTQGDKKWSRSHAIAPTPVLLDEDTIRVFFTTLDENGIGRPGYIDVSSNDPTKIKRISNTPILDVGVPGTFDDNGVMPLSIVQAKSNHLLMFYSGFELLEKIRYRIMTGLAISEDGGNTFTKYSSVPILDRSESELFFRGGCFVMFDEDKFKMWYVGGSNWINLSGKDFPVYNLRYLESIDGINWGRIGKISMELADNNEHGFGRPWVIKNHAENYELFYSIRKTALRSYRLGYARSENGIKWLRLDESLGLNVSSSGFDSNAIMYAAVLSTQEKTYCFYNGNNFGEDGIAVAEKLNEF